MRIDARDMNTVLWYGGGFLQLIGYTKEQFEKELNTTCAYVHPEDMERTIGIMKNSKKQEWTRLRKRASLHAAEKQKF